MEETKQVLEATKSEIKEDQTTEDQKVTESQQLGKEYDVIVNPAHIIAAIILSVLLPMLALQRVIFPSLGKLKQVFIVDVAILLSALVTWLCTVSFELKAAFVFTIITSVLCLVLFIITLIDVVKLYCKTKLVKN